MWRLGCGRNVKLNGQSHGEVDSLVIESGIPRWLTKFVNSCSFSRISEKSTTRVYSFSQGSSKRQASFGSQDAYEYQSKVFSKHIEACSRDVDRRFSFTRSSKGVDVDGAQLEIINRSSLESEGKIASARGGSKMPFV